MDDFDHSMETQQGHIIRWFDDRNRQAYKLALLGATDKQIANVMGIGLSTLDLWKRTKPEFRLALQRGKLEADANIAEALYKRAHGFTFVETLVHMYKGKIIKTKIEKYVIPDSWAANKWLAARQRANGIWTDTKRIEGTLTNINVQKVDLSALTESELLLLKKVGVKTMLSENAGSSN
jgi:hypothetical protein